jgi:hypothetical protein
MRSRRVVGSVAASLLVIGGTAGVALAAYPPVKGPAPKAKCSISTIIDRRVAMSCAAGKVRAGMPATFIVKKKVVARGRIARDGRFAARFTAPTLLTRGTNILFNVQGKTLFTVRV